MSKNLISGEGGVGRETADNSLFIFLWLSSFRLCLHSHLFIQEQQQQCRFLLLQQEAGNVSPC